MYDHSTILKGEYMKFSEKILLICIIGLCVGHVNALFGIDRVAGLVVPAAVVAVVISAKLTEDLLAGILLVASFWVGVAAIIVGMYTGSGVYPVWIHSVAFPAAVVASVIFLWVTVMLVMATQKISTIRRARNVRGKRKSNGFRSAKERWAQDSVPVAKTVNLDFSERALGNGSHYRRETIPEEKRVPYDEELVLDPDTRAYCPLPTTDGVDVEDITEEIPTLTQDNIVRAPN